MEMYVDVHKFKRKVSVFLVEDKGHEETYFHIGPDGLVAQTVSKNDYQEVKAFLEMPQYLFDEFLNGLINYSSKKGLRTEYESKLQGKIEAKEEHLKDLQMITKKLLKIT